jgi:hypothetical protein
VNNPVLEPMLTFKLSDNDFRCSACEREVASSKNSRLVVVGIADLIATFKTHVGLCHSAPK